MQGALNYLPEFLVISTFLTGIIWGVDRAKWRPVRLAAAAQLEASTPEDARDSDDYVMARETVLREPPIMEWGGGFFPVLAFVLVLRSFIIEPFVIPSGSMIPTLEVGDFILVNKYAYGLRLPVVGTKVVDVGEPQRGEVMVFYPPHVDQYYIKRVIGLPGDTVRWRDGHLTINGEQVGRTAEGRDETRFPPVNVFTEHMGDVSHTIHLADYGGASDGTWRIPEGHYFMMGDNRDNSFDSRGWGPVPEENIVGRAMAVWMHKEPGWNLPSFERNGSIE